MFKRLKRNASKPKRALIIGLDGASPESVEMFMAQGKLPNMRKLMERGVFARAMPVLPTHTPVNWTTIGTGVWPGTHGITGFSIHHRGEPLSRVHSAFDTREVQAEFLWNAAERVGKKCILMKWAGPMFPVTVKKGIQVDGCFCVECKHEISGPRVYSLEEPKVNVDGKPASTKINLKPASHWKNVSPINLKPLESTLEIGSPNLKVTLHLLLIDSGSKGYDRVILSKTKNVKDKICVLSVGQWSEWIRLDFQGENSVTTGTLRLKLVELGKDASKLKIYCSQIMPITGWTYPKEIAKELVENIGPFLQRPGYCQEGLIYGGWVDHETFMEEMEYQHDWFARASVYLLKIYDWDLFFMQTHALDYIFDNLIRWAEPLTAPNKKKSNEYMELIGRTYEQVDKMIGRIIDEVADRDTLIAVVSDHGVIGYHSPRTVSEIVRDILIKNKLLFYKGEKEEAKEIGSKPAVGISSIDWSRTKAIYHDSIYIYINLKGREPNGVVEPNEYEEVRDQIIEALYSYKDPKLGKCPFSLVLRSEDARILGLYGDRIGDIVFTVREGGLYGEGHGVYLPTAEYGISSLHALLIMAGPGVKRNYELKRTVWLTDISPTIAHLMDIPPPKQAEGAILYEALDFI